MTFEERCDLVQTILDEYFSKLKMQAFGDRHKPGDIVCSWNLNSCIFLDKGEVVRNVIEDRILEMLKDAKKLIERNIERLLEEAEIL